MVTKTLVLGIDGMVGNAVWKYLSSNPNICVFGTSRENYNSKNAFRLEIKTLQSDLQQIPSVEVIINCIGALKGNKEQLIETNANFPKKIATFAKKRGIRLIHISTDAVFNQNLGAVDESSIPNPKGNYNEEYAQSKLNGEILELPNLTIRTSLLGIGKSGLLQNILDSNDESFSGFHNQVWSGCTSLQFARLCEEIIVGQKSATKLSDTALIHFAPIGPITKYDIVTSANEVFKLKKKVIPGQSIPITRFLTSKILDLKGNPRYTNSIRAALLELKDFYKL